MLSKKPTWRSGLHLNLFVGPTEASDASHIVVASGSDWLAETSHTVSALHCKLWAKTLVSVGYLMGDAPYEIRKFDQARACGAHREHYRLFVSEACRAKHKIMVADLDEYSSMCATAAGKSYKLSIALCTGGPSDVLRAFQASRSAAGTKNITWVVTKDEEAACVGALSASLSLPPRNAAQHVHTMSRVVAQLGRVDRNSA